MSNPWFRLYAEFAVDPKVQMLSEVDQRRFIMLLCLRCSNGDVTLHDEEIAFQLRVSNEEWASSKARLMEKMLINDDAQPCAWEKRQFVSDSSVARVRRHRDKLKQPCNVTVTTPDTDTDTDTEKEKSKKKKVDDGDEGFVQFWTAYPHKVGKVEALRAFGKLKPDGKMLREILAGLERYKANKPAWQEWKNPGPWLNQRRWDDMPHTCQSAASQHPQPDWLQGVV